MELNASDTRSKNSLKEIIAESLNNTSIKGFYSSMWVFELFWGEEGYVRKTGSVLCPLTSIEPYCVPGTLLNPGANETVRSTYDVTLTGQ